MKLTKIKVDFPIFKIVGDGIMASPSIGEGRFIPSLIIDIGENQEISELIALHKDSLPGDTELAWSKPNTFFKIKSVFLNLDFLKPMKVKFAIEFDLATQYSLVDGIIESKGFYLQTGKSGDKITNLETGSILIEVPNLEFNSIWNNILKETLKSKYKKEGASKSEAIKYTNEHISRMREIWNMRKASS
jgi:hypothetical protein